MGLKRPPRHHVNTISDAGSLITLKSLITETVPFFLSVLRPCYIYILDFPHSVLSGHTMRVRSLVHDSGTHSRTHKISWELSEGLSRSQGKTRDLMCLQCYEPLHPVGPSLVLFGLIRTCNANRGRTNTKNRMVSCIHNVHIKRRCRVCGCCPDGDPPVVHDTRKHRSVKDIGTTDMYKELLSVMCHCYLISGYTGYRMPKGLTARV